MLLAAVAARHVSDIADVSWLVLWEPSICSVKLQPGHLPFCNPTVASVLAFDALTFSSLSGLQSLIDRSCASRSPSCFVSESDDKGVQHAIMCSKRPGPAKDSEIPNSLFEVLHH